MPQIVVDIFSRQGKTSSLNPGQRRSGKLYDGSGGTPLPEQHPCAQQGQADKSDEGPVGDRQAQKAPVDLGAVTTATKDHGNGPLEREGLDHAVEVAPAGV